MQILHVHKGDLVLARRDRWRVVDISPYDGCQIVTLAGAGPANTGRHCRLISPFDHVEPIATRDPWRLQRASTRRWRRTLRSLLADHTPPDRLRAAARAKMDLLPHQLEPALAVVRGRGTRVLIADEVGLGKTIQAALIVAELRERGAADRVLVLTPAGLRDQWAG